MTVPLGTKLRDNDPRAKGNVVVATGYYYANDPQVSLIPTHVTYRSSRRISRIRVDRIFFDGKTRQVGYNVVQ